MGLWTLAQGIVLIANGFAVLNNDRFLEKVGLGYSQMGAGANGGEGPGSLKQTIIGALHAIGYLRVPLILANALVILIMLVSF